MLRSGIKFASLEYENIFNIYTFKYQPTSD